MKALFLPFLVLFISAITFAEEKDRLTVTLDSRSPINVVTPAERGTVALQLNSRSAIPLRFSYRIDLLDAGGKRMERLSGDIELAAGKTLRIPLPAETKFGIRKVHCTISGDVSSHHKFSYAYLIPAGPNTIENPHFLFGINTHSLRCPPEERELEALAAVTCGAKAVRDWSEWTVNSSTPGELRFDKTDKLVALYEKHGIEVMPVLAFGPMWALDPNWKPLTNDRKRYGTRWARRGKPSEAAWRDYVYRTVERYRGKIRFVEIWNEPDLPGFANFSLQDYCSLLQWGYEEARRANPSIRVLNGGFASIRGVARSVESNYVENFLRRTGGRNCDMLAIHEHSSYPRYRDSINLLKELMRKHAVHKPWLPNETAYPAVPGCATELEQAYLLWQKLLFSWSRGASGYFWYDLRNDGYDPLNAEHNFGMLTRDFQPKAVYAACNTLTRYFGGARFIRTLTDAESTELFLFQAASGDWLVPFWTFSAAGSPALLLSGISGKAELIDLWGNVSPLTVSNGTVSIISESHPAFLRICGTEPKLRGKLIEFDRELRVAGTKPIPFSLRIHNPSASELSGALEFEPPEQYSLQKRKIAFSIPAGQSAVCSNTIALRKSVDLKWKTSLKIHCRTSSFGNGTVTIPVDFVRKLEPLFNKNPDFLLNSGEQTVLLVPQMEQNRHLYWTSPDDLSAKIYFAVQADSLCLRIEVRDDIHMQPYTGKECWQGDSVQLALAIPRQRGMWELGFSLGPDGKPEVWCWETPKGFSTTECRKEISLKCSRDESSKLTHYEVRIPFRTIGLTRKIGQEGFSFNLLVNDNDGELRESFMRLAPGMGDGIKDAAAYPILIF